MSKRQFSLWMICPRWMLARRLHRSATAQCPRRASCTARHCTEYAPHSSQSPAHPPQTQGAPEGGRRSGSCNRWGVSSCAGFVVDLGSGGTPVVQGAHYSSIAFSTGLPSGIQLQCGWMGAMDNETHYCVVILSDGSFLIVGPTAQR